MRSCGEGDTFTEPKVITKVETKWDTLRINSTVYVLIICIIIATANNTKPFFHIP